MKRPFGRIDQIWNFKDKIVSSRRSKVCLKNPSTNLCSSDLESHALHRNTIY